MRPIALAGSLIAALLLLAVRAQAEPMQPMTTVTVDDLFPTRTLEVEVGTEVVFSDPRFLRVEFVPDAGAPVASRIDGGYRAVFAEPGVFRFLSTVSGVERAGVVPCQIIVRPRPGTAFALFDYSQARPGVTEAEWERAQEECLQEPRTAGSRRLYEMCLQAHGVLPFQ